MTIVEIWEQAKTLSVQDRKELAKLLIDSLETRQDDVTSEKTEHWGQNLLRLLDEVGPIELIYPEIEDPVEWVKQIRRDQQQQRLGDWGREE